MNKERLEWIMSGLIRYNLTKNENQFVILAERDFNKKICLQSSRKKDWKISIRKNQN